MANKTNRCGGIMKDKVLLIPPSKIVAPAPADLLMKDFDVKSEKPKNKRNYSKAMDLNEERYGPSATQSKFAFDKKNSALYKKYCNKSRK